MFFGVLGYSFQRSGETPTVGVSPRPSGYWQDEKHCEELHVVAEHGLKY